MEKIITIDGKEVGLKASALTPRIYRAKVGRDLMQDMANLRESFTRVKDKPAEEQFSVIDLTIFEDVAYIMAKQYDHSIPDTPEEWLDDFSMFSIIEVLPEIFELWARNVATTAEPKKK